MDRPFVVRDWRFGKYEVDGLQDPLSSVVRYVREGAMFSNKNKNNNKKEKQQQQEKKQEQEKQQPQIQTPDMAVA